MLLLNSCTKKLTLKKPLLSWKVEVVKAKLEISTEIRDA